MNVIVRDILSLGNPKDGGADRVWSRNRFLKSLGISHYVQNGRIVGTDPKVLNLKEILEYYVAHQKDVITRRTRFDLNKTKEREHIVKGLVIALANIDEVIAIIKRSKDKDDASKQKIHQTGIKIFQEKDEDKVLNFTVDNPEFDRLSQTRQQDVLKRITIKRQGAE